MSEPNARFPGWDWDHPDDLAVRLDEFSADVATCKELTAHPGPLPRTHAEFTEIGVTGIEFAAFRTAHPAGLGTDLATLRGPDAATEPGTLYRVDGDRQGACPEVADLDTAFRTDETIYVEADR
ncbi:hypothetical protein ACPC54_20010 [Kitasatospora sp. NPDC094028]